MVEKVDASDDLVNEKDVKTEVMRSRGAGGQVSDTGSAEIPLKADLKASGSTSTKPSRQYG